ncbi:putative P450 monooxygenase [Saccharata proteae CBS 121410]|uniref:P450 monooxygenase n=1 Tax=Saccharata proteae CBS 121410 TaxID=1314787 RepID=A0A9P4HWH2_9PEZI|nr:putative P450 monooxygenase [Saccharata proteae CBS 121410]
MHNALLYGLWAVASFVIYKFVNFIAKKRRHAIKARELGCQPPPVWDSKDILGITNTIKIVQAGKANRVPDYVVERFETISKREGRPVSTMKQNTAGDTQIFTADPKNIQALLATQFKDFVLGETRTNNFAPLLGYGIFTSDGKMWEHSRAMLRPQFARDQVSDLELEETHVQNLLKALPVDPSTGWTDVTDIEPLFFRLTLDSATEFLFGESVDSQLANLPGKTDSTPIDPARDEKAFAYAFDSAQGFLAQGARLGDMYWLAHNAEFKQLCKQVHVFVDSFVQQALNQVPAEKDVEKTGNSDGSKKKHKYILSHALAEQTRDPIELRAQMLNILLAGRDTTASLLSWLFMLLAQHPSIFKKLRTAILDDFGPYKETPAESDITFSKLKNCTYLQHTLSETLRLYPLVPLNSRRAHIDTSIPRGGGPDGTAPIFVPKGTEVNYSVHVMHHSRTLWGPDAELFKPERWEGRKAGWEFLPFNGGPRICIGQQFALTEASFVVVRLLQRFETLEAGEGLGEVRAKGKEGLHGLSLTNCPSEGVRVRLREAGRA